MTGYSPIIGFRFAKKLPTINIYTKGNIDTHVHLSLHLRLSKVGQQNF